MVDICGYKLPTNLQNFTQRDLTEVKIFQKFQVGYFFEIPCILAVDGWAVTFGTARLGGLRPRPVPSLLYQM